MGSVIQTYDIVMLVVLLGAAVYGAWKGMAWQLASLASMLLSAAAAVHFSAPLAPYFSAQEPWNRFLAMLVLFVLTSLVIWLLFRFVAGIIERVKLKEFDRQMGALFGLTKGALLCIVITFFAVTLSESARQMVLKSHSGDIIARITRNANPLLPADIRAVLGKYIDELDQKLDHNTPPSTAEEKNISPEDWKKDVSQELEQKIHQASKRIEEIGHQAEEKLEAVGRQPGQTYDP